MPWKAEGVSAVLVITSAGISFVEGSVTKSAIRRILFMPIQCTTFLYVQFFQFFLHVYRNQNLQYEKNGERSGISIINGY